MGHGRLTFIFIHNSLPQLPIGVIKSDYFHLKTHIWGGRSFMANTQSRVTKAAGRTRSTAGASSARANTGTAAGASAGWVLVKPKDPILKAVLSFINKPLYVDWDAGLVRFGERNGITVQLAQFNRKIPGAILSNMH